MLVPADFFSKSSFTKNYSRNTIGVASSLDPDQAQQNVGLIWVEIVRKCYQQTILVKKVKVGVAFERRIPQYSFKFLKLNRHYRLAAYRQFVCWMLCGEKLGMGNRVVILSCVVKIVREKFLEKALENNEELFQL